MKFHIVNPEMSINICEKAQNSSYIWEENVFLQKRTFERTNFNNKGSFFQNNFGIIALIRMKFHMINTEIFISSCEEAENSSCSWGDKIFAPKRDFGKAKFQ